MSRLRNRLASGARWTMSIRVVERVIGFVSTLILARLLAPADFGVVAMGTAIQEILAAITSFGFTQALIRMPRRDHGAYSTAFTLNALTGLGIALVLLIAIPFAQTWYDDARVTGVLVVLALVSLIAGLRNSGLVRYERALDFRPFFAIALARKSTSLVVGAACALLWRDYRALLAAMLAGAIVETAIGYRLTRFRPRLTLEKARELFGFSVWWLMSQAAGMLGRRGQDVIVGQRMGAESLGQYAVALDLSTMATTEIVAPVMRAIYPGYVLMKDDSGRFFSAFSRVWGVIALLAITRCGGHGVSRGNDCRRGTWAEMVAGDPVDELTRRHWRSTGDAQLLLASNVDETRSEGEFPVHRGECCLVDPFLCDRALDRWPEDGDFSLDRQRGDHARRWSPRGGPRPAWQLCTIATRTDTAGSCDRSDVGLDPHR